LKKFEEEILIEEAKYLKVLYVQKDRLVRKELSNFLNKYFKKVVSTIHADNAIKLFQSDFFDLIITDMHIPDLDSEILCSNIKQIASKKPIIIISQKDDVNKLINLVNIGISGYIKYPLEHDNVIKILSNVVREIGELKMMYNYQDNLENNDKVHPKPSNKTKNTQKENKSKAINLLLTKRRENVSAVEFLDKYPINLSNSIESILTINETFDVHLNAFIHNPSEKNIQIVTEELEKFSSVLSNIEEFNDMAFTINKLALVFQNLEPNKSYKEYLEVFFDISDSLNQWFNDIFINKSASNIHFLDQSMLADALTLENIFRQTDSDDDNIEFF
jgi:DNA-binding NarL/FixJ family response regulator